MIHRTIKRHWTCGICGKGFDIETGHYIFAGDDQYCLRCQEKYRHGLGIRIPKKEAKQ